MQFLRYFFTKLVHICIWGKSYTSYIKWVLSCDFLITPENGNIDGGGGECNFSSTILKENCLKLQLPINFFHAIDEACMHGSPEAL